MSKEKCEVFRSGNVLGQCCPAGILHSVLSGYRDSMQPQAFQPVCRTGKMPVPPSR